MLSKAKIKYINSLKHKKYRQKYNNFVAEGDKIAREILKHQPKAIELIIATQQWADSQQSIPQYLNSKINIVTSSNLKKISSLQTPNQVLFIVQQLIRPTISLENQLTLVLDRIQDPGNMGTILRIADWFGINQVVCSADCVDIYNPKVVQSTMGAFLRVKTYYQDIVKLCEQTHLPIYGAVLQGENLFKIKPPKAGLIVIGNESKGISGALQNQLTHRITIPSNGGAESLNAGVATGIICAAFRNL